LIQIHEHGLREFGDSEFMDPDFRQDDGKGRESTTHIG
jgi:hypothetical protein